MWVIALVVVSSRSETRRRYATRAKLVRLGFRATRHATLRAAPSLFAGRARATFRPDLAEESRTSDVNTDDAWPPARESSWPKTIERNKVREESRSRTRREEALRSARPRRRLAREVSSRRPDSSFRPPVRNRVVVTRRISGRAARFSRYDRRDAGNFECRVVSRARVSRG